MMSRAISRAMRWLRSRCRSVYFRNFVPHTAPRLIHSVRTAISFGGSFGPGGICRSPSCRSASMRMLCSGLPGTTAGPRLPPFKRLSRSRNEMFPFFRSSLWQGRQRFVRIGATLRSKKRSSRSAASRQLEQQMNNTNRSTYCFLPTPNWFPAATTLPLEIVTSSSFSLCT